MQQPKIIAVDFDGTLCVGDHWPRIGYPNAPILEYVLYEQKHNGSKIILWTNRIGNELDEAIEWCKRYGLFFDAVNENVPETKKFFGEQESRKIFAHVFIDDRAVNPSDIARIIRK